MQISLLIINIPLKHFRCCVNIYVLIYCKGVMPFRRMFMDVKKLNRLPCAITFVRIVGTVCLLFLKPLSAAFYTVYAVSGLSDVLDGYAARKLKASSEFGARLDSIADLLFYAVMLLKLFSLLWEQLPRGIWCGVLAVLLIRIASYVTAAVRFHRFAAVHTYLNKLTGAMVFLLPFFMGFGLTVIYSTAVCAVSGISSLEELILHLTEGTYSADHKTLLAKRGK